MRKKLKIIVPALIVVLALIITSILVYNSDLNQIERRYEIDFPKSSKVEHYEDARGWFGEGDIFVELVLDANELDDLYNSLKSSKPSENSFEVMKYDIEDIIDTHYRNNEGEFVINWENEVSIVDGKGSDSLYYIFDFTTNRFYIVEQVW